VVTTIGDMDDAEGKGELALLGDLRENLRRQLDSLSDKRKSIEAQLEALGKELKGVDVEEEAMRRMLGLVEGTEQQLAAQGQEELHESGPDHAPVEPRVEVRGGVGRMGPVCL
jgi:chromosome segregation ATPase